VRRFLMVLASVSLIMAALVSCSYKDRPGLGPSSGGSGSLTPVGTGTVGTTPGITPTPIIINLNPACVGTSTVSTFSSSFLGVTGTWKVVGSLDPSTFTCPGASTGVINLVVAGVPIGTTGTSYVQLNGQLNSKVNATKLNNGHIDFDLNLNPVVYTPTGTTYTVTVLAEKAMIHGLTSDYVLNASSTPALSTAGSTHFHIPLATCFGSGRLGSVYNVFNFQIFFDKLCPNGYGIGSISNIQWSSN